VRYDFQAFYLFNEAGRLLPGYSSDNVFIQQAPMSDLLNIIYFGASKNITIIESAAYSCVK